MARRAGGGLPERAPLHGQLQQDGQSQVLVLKRNVAFGAGAAVDVTESRALESDETVRDRGGSPSVRNAADLRNLVALSTTSSHTDETVPSSKSVASGRARSASRDSCSSSLQRSASSPGNHRHSFGIQPHITFPIKPLLKQEEQN